MNSTEMLLVGAAATMTEAVLSRSWTEMLRMVRPRFPPLAMALSQDALALTTLRAAATNRKWLGRGGS